MESAVFTFMSGIFRIVGNAGWASAAFVTLWTVIRVLRFLVRGARGERYADMAEETTEYYDRSRANYYARGARGARGTYYAEMRQGRGYRGRQTRY